MLQKSTRNKLIALFIVAAMVVIVAGLCVGSEWTGLRGSVSDWFVSVEAASLVQFSERIVIARYVDETVHEIPNSPTAYPKSPTSFVDVYRRFEVVESLKGGFTAGDTAHVAWKVGYARGKEKEDPQFIRRDVIPLSHGETYVLILNRHFGRRPDNWDVKVRVWATPDGLDVARMDAQGRLSFQTTQFYRNALEYMDLKPVPGSGAPFELTTSDIRALVSANSAGNE